MRVGIDATSLLVPKKTGIEYYTTSLTLAIIEALPQYPNLELFLYLHQGDRYADASLLSTYLPKLKQAKIRTWNWARGYRFALPIMTFRDRLNLLHLPRPGVLPFLSCPTLITVHDLCWIRLPQDIVAGERMVNMAEAEEAFQQASSLIAVSNSTRDDLIAEYGVKPERIWVTHEGVDPKYRANPDIVENIRSKYGLSQYILCVSTLQRRKNLVRLIEAYKILLNQYNIPQQLVLVGSKGWGHEEVYNAVERLELQDKVIFPSYIPEEELLGLYTGAELFVYPSLYEGFGLPVLEAMACGAPVATANTSSLPEVAGDAGLYFDPLDVNDMAQTIYQAIDNMDLNKDLRRRSLIQAKQFSWQETAHQTLNAYHSLANETLSYAKAHE